MVMSKKLNTTKTAQKNSWLVAYIVRASIVIPLQTFAALNLIFRWWLLIRLGAKQTGIFCLIDFICFIHCLRFFNVGLF